MAYTTVDDPSENFQAKIYEGTSGVHNVTLDGNSDMQPDLVWFKNRDVGYSNQLYDSSRGTTKALFSDVTNVETTVSNGLTLFQSDGFRVSSAAAVNEDSMVCWNWKANAGSTSSFTESGNNPGGTIQTNTAGGFSIIAYTGTGAPGNIAHGLPSAPEWIIFKRRDATNVWACWHVALGDDYKIVLNSTDGKDADASFMNSTLPDATNIRVGDSGNPNTNADTATYICYAWSPIQGYSKFGSYYGNGDTNAPFVYTGFKPAYILLKKSSDNGDNWMVYDDKRSDSNGNVVDRALRPNSDAAEYDNANANIDILSNGFKLRSSFGWVNQSSHTYIYMAWAENPFVTSTGIPTTAR